MTPKKALEKILDTLFPPVCIFCKAAAFEAHFCGDCERHLTPSQPLLTQNYKELAVFEYNETTMKAIKDLKYQGKTHIAKAMAHIIAEKYGEELKNASIICAVPTHNLKLFWRKYNQAATIARHLAKILGMEFRPSLLKRCKLNISQTTLRRKDRLKNLESSFALNPRLRKKIEGKAVIVIDDVITTGATIAACRKQIETASPLSIYAVSFAKTPLKECSLNEPSREAA